MKRVVLAIFTLAAILLTFTPPTLAGSATANLSVTVEVDRSCIISTTPVTFPVYTPLNASPDDSSGGSVIVVCTTGVSATVALGMGLNYTGTQRMSSSGNYLTYALYSDNTHTNQWVGANTVVLAPAPNTDPRTLPIYGRIPAGQDIPDGTYADTVVSTINF